MLGYSDVMRALTEHVLEVAADTRALGDEKAAAMMAPLGYGVETTGLVQVAKEFAHAPLPPEATMEDAQAMAFVAGFQVAARLFCPEVPA